MNKSELNQFNRNTEPHNGHGHENGKHNHLHNGNGHHHDYEQHPETEAVIFGESETDIHLRSPEFLEKYELNFPPVDTDAIQAAVTQILQAAGEDPQREGLLNTPRRVAGAYEELLSGYRTDPAELINNAIFDVEYDDMVIVRDIEYASLCEHHLLPFLGHAHVAYIPGEKVIGLSKIPRIVDMFSHRLQVQERLTRQIADFIEEVLGAKGVAVVMDGMHLCSKIRGVHKCHSGMTTSAFLGVFKEDKDLRTEFMAHLERAAGKKSIL